VEAARDIETLVRALAARTEEPVIDSYFFLVRVGRNYDKYPFGWEPFRDLAGPLEPWSWSGSTRAGSSGACATSTASWSRAGTPAPTPTCARCRSSTWRRSSRYR
jgi:hypothetical protein